MGRNKTTAIKQKHQVETSDGLGFLFPGTPMKQLTTQT